MKLAAVILCLLASAAQGVTVQFAPASLGLAPGSSADVSVRLDQPFETGLAAFGLTITYDPARVAVTATVVPQLDHDFTGGPADVFTAPGEVSVLGMTAIENDAFVSYDDLPLLTLHLQDLDTGSSPYLLTITDFDSSTQWVSPAFDELDAQVSYGQPLLVSTPEPGIACGLLLGGLLIARRRTSTVIPSGTPRGISESSTPFGDSSRNTARNDVP